MNWHTTDFTIIGPTMYAGDRWCGTFSSHTAALAGLRIMRNGGTDGSLCESDTDLLAAIDADEE